MPITFTRADYDLLPEAFPAQLLEGQLVKEPAPTHGHQALVGARFRILAPLVEPGLLLTAPSDVVLDDHDVLQPDLVVLERAPPDDARDVGIPLLAVEVLSPAPRARDQHVKTPRLLAAGVGEVWIVDAERSVIVRHDAHGARQATGTQTLLSGVLDGLSLFPAPLFTRSSGPGE